MKIVADLPADTRRRTLWIAAQALLLCARGNGVDDSRLKVLVLTMRMPELAVLTDDEAAQLISRLDLESA